MVGPEVPRGLRKVKYSLIGKALHLVGRNGRCYASLDFWEQNLRAEASLLPSLYFFNASFMSLSNPHPIWLHARSPFEVGKAVIVARMISGRYKTDRLSRHWASDNPDGLCCLPGCMNQEGNLLHILLHCPALADTRAKMISFWSAFLVSKPALFPVVQHYTMKEEHLFPQFLLDPSCLPLVISTNQAHPSTLQDCLFISRTWCYAVHLARSKLIRAMNLR